MVFFATLVSLTVLLPQEPATSRPMRDRVLLHNGSSLEGTISVQTKDYVEVRLDDGTMVGFERKIVASIESREAEAQAAPGPRPGQVTPRDHWFLLHDGEGALRGRLHETLTVGEEVRIGEEWSFATEKGLTEITLLEVLGGDLQPLSCFVHERTHDNTGERMTSERVVRAHVRAGRLEVATQTLTGGEQRSYEMLPKTAFPLTARERIRRQLVEPGQGNMQVFDLRSEEMRDLVWQIGPHRKVSDGKKVLDVRELKTSWGNVENVEWLDAAGTCIRREVSGPALVAVPTSGETARGVVKYGGPLREGAIRKEKQGRFGLWLPNPSWRADGEVQDGQVLVRNEIEDATVDLVLLEHLDKGLGLESVGDAVMRWLKLLRPDLKIEKRSRGAVRAWPAVSIEACFARNVGGPGDARKSRTWVFVAHGKTLAMTCESSARPSPALEADLARMLQMADVAPR
jgi:hypothetical protein